MSTKLTKLQIPAKFHRNHLANTSTTDSGKALIDYALKILDMGTLGNLDVLDIGCGVRFAQTIINHQLSIKSYAGIDIDEEMVDMLQERLGDKDPRFSFYHINIWNDLYNQTGVPFTELGKLPVEDRYDVIWLFSVFTHLNPDDSRHMLKLMSKHLSPGGKLLFTTHINDEITKDSNSGFVDYFPDEPLKAAVYSRATMDKMLDDNGWKVEFFKENTPEHFIADHYICTLA